MNLDHLNLSPLLLHLMIVHSYNTQYSTMIMCIIIAENIGL